MVVTYNSCWQALVLKAAMPHYLSDIFHINSVVNTWRTDPQRISLTQHVPFTTTTTLHSSHFVEAEVSGWWHLQRCRMLFLVCWVKVWALKLHGLVNTVLKLLRSQPLLNVCARNTCNASRLYLILLIVWINQIKTEPVSEGRVTAVIRSNTHNVSTATVFAGILEIICRWPMYLNIHQSPVS